MQETLREIWLTLANAEPNFEVVKQQILAISDNVKPWEDFILKKIQGVRNFTGLCKLLCQLNTFQPITDEEKQAVIHQILQPLVIRQAKLLSDQRDPDFYSEIHTCANQYQLSGNKSIPWFSQLLTTQSEKELVEILHAARIEELSYLFALFLQHQLLAELPPVALSIFLKQLPFSQFQFCQISDIVKTPENLCPILNDWLADFDAQSQREGFWEFFRTQKLLAIEGILDLPCMSPKNSLTLPTCTQDDLHGDQPMDFLQELTENSDLPLNQRNISDQLLAYGLLAVCIGRTYEVYQTIQQANPTNGELQSIRLENAQNLKQTYETQSPFLNCLAQTPVFPNHIIETLRKHLKLSEAAINSYLHIGMHCDSQDQTSKSVVETALKTLKDHNQPNVSPEMTLYRPERKIIRIDPQQPGNSLFYFFPKEVKARIYQYLLPEEGLGIALIDKAHLEVANLFWQNKFDIHFQHRKQNLKQYEDQLDQTFVPFARAFHILYEEEYQYLNKEERILYSQFKEGRWLPEHAGLIFQHTRRYSLIDWVKRNDKLSGLGAMCNPVEPSTKSLNQLKREYALSNQQDKLLPLLTQNHINDTLLNENTVLHYAAQAGHEDLCQILIQEKGANFNAKNKNDERPIECAVANGHMPVLRLLLKCGTIPNETTLQYAAKNGYVDIMELLFELAIQKTIDPSKWGLCDAIRAGHTNIVELILKVQRIFASSLSSSAEQFRFKYQVSQAMNAAVAAGQAKILKILIQQYPKLIIETTGFNQSSPMHAAAQMGRLEIVQVLLKMHPEWIVAQDSNGNLPIHLAAKQGHQAVVEVLVQCLEYSETIHTKNLNGKLPIELTDDQNIKALLLRDNADHEEKLTTFHVAINRGDFQAVQSQLDIDPQLGIQQDQDGNLPIHLAAANGHLEFVEILFTKYPVTMTARDRNSNLPIHLAAANGHAQVVQWTLKNDYYPAIHKARNEDAKQPIHLAAENGHKSVIELLLMMEDRESIIHAEMKHGILPIQLAAKNGHTEVVALLLQCEKEIKKLRVQIGVMSEEMTKEYYQGAAQAIHFAVANGHIEVVQLLLSENPSLIEAKSSKELMPIDTAAAHGQLTMVEYLQPITPGRIDNPPIELAVENGHIEVVQLFLSKNPSLIAQKLKMGQLMYLAVVAGHVNMLNCLRKYSSDTDIVSYRQYNGYGLIHSAAQSGKVEVINWLLEIDTQLINQPTLASPSYLPIQVAARAGQAEVVERLLTINPELLDIKTDDRPIIQPVAENNSVSPNPSVSDHSLPNNVPTTPAISTQNNFEISKSSDTPVALQDAKSDPEGTQESLTIIPTNSAPTTPNTQVTTHSKTLFQFKPQTTILISTLLFVIIAVALCFSALSAPFWLIPTALVAGIFFGAIFTQLGNYLINRCSNANLPTGCEKQDGAVYNNFYNDHTTEAKLDPMTSFTSPLPINNLKPHDKIPLNTANLSLTTGGN